jgi:hypothetical protein
MITCANTFLSILQNEAISLGLCTENFSKKLELEKISMPILKKKMDKSIIKKN